MVIAFSQEAATPVSLNRPVDPSSRARLEPFLDHEFGPQKPGSMAKRYRLVNFDANVLLEKSEPDIPWFASIELFPDLTVTIENYHVAYPQEANVLWVGRVVGVDDSYSRLSTLPDGKIYGYIVTSGTLYRMWPTEEPPYHKVWERIPFDPNRVVDADIVLDLPDTPVDRAAMEAGMRASDEAAGFPPPDMVRMREEGLKEREEMLRQFEEEKERREAANLEAACNLAEMKDAGFWPPDPIPVGPDGEPLDCETR